MSRYCRLSRSRALGDTFVVATTPLLDFLEPAFHHHGWGKRASRRSISYTRQRDAHLETYFYNALSQASLCKEHRAQQPPRKQQIRYASSAKRRRLATAMNHQRYDSRGRLLIETTPARQPAFQYPENSDHEYRNLYEYQFAQSSKLPKSFFTDVNAIRNLTPEPDSLTKSQETSSVTESASLDKQMKLLERVRQLEEKLARAKENLARSRVNVGPMSSSLPQKSVLTKKDYLNLVDLYFYSHNSRFSPESSDSSPTPIVLDDYSFSLSADFTQGDTPELQHEDEEEDYVSPLKEIEQQLKQNKLKEIAVMQVFIDLLLDDESPNRALYQAYRELPKPGVAYLPKGVIRLFLQRMSTPWIKSQASMLRYLSLIDDMQEAKLPITVAEWSSAIYLAGRSFIRIDNDQVTTAFNIWKQMENEASVKSSAVTFNILFDVAVRAGKFSLGETILMEMHKRNLRLNRMGRVSLMYYHGLRGDGDGVRKAYHDFVEAGEIVDTLVLNCVIASLINAQEPTAAEQIYQRMKDLQKNLKRMRNQAGDEVLFKLHPAPGSSRIGEEMASNSLGRILARAPHLKSQFPDSHQNLQAAMPLTPNFTTFRTMLAYHTSVTGDLDRVTVLLKEMLEDFDIPLFPVVFQLLFKGFALHGSKGDSESLWSKSRLDMIWAACRTAIRDANNPNLADEVVANPALPSITVVNDSLTKFNEAVETGQTQTRTLNMWQELVIDLAAFPRERLKRLQRYSSREPDDGVPSDNFQSPFFEQSQYAAPQPDIDKEEGEYTLPDPIRSTLVNPRREKYDPYVDEDPEITLDHDEERRMDEHLDRPPTAPTEGFEHSSFSKFNRFVEDPRTKYRLVPSKPLVCWLLRAYAQVTRSRAQVEEVWGVIRKMWSPEDEVEARRVVKELLRCLRDCDRLNGLG